jgi:tetratricopeptide (TPR) repeat protein
MLAGDTNYAFNELLQQTAEHGIVGGLLLVFIFISVFLTKKQHFGKFRIEDSENSLLNENLFIIISKATLLSIVIFSMFSYPVQILPIKISLIVTLAYLSNSQKNLFLYPPLLRNKGLPTYGIYIGKGMALCLTAFFVLYGARFLKTQEKALKDWNFAFVLYNLGNYGSSIKEYSLAMPVLYHNGDFLTNYGKALSMVGEHEKAVKVLLQAARYYPNTVVSTALGDSYKATGQNKNAETAYQHGWYMNPSRFYPKYLLAKLYYETGQTEKAVFIANELLRIQAKIESTAMEEIRTEMLEIIKKAGIETLTDDDDLIENIFDKQSKHKGAYLSRFLNVGFKLQMW